MNKAIFTQNDKYLMLAFDHRQGFNKILNPAHPELVSADEALIAKKLVINVFASECSGLLLDPEIGLPAFKNRTTPYLLCLEKTGYTDTGHGRLTILEYKSAELKKLGASGTKLLIYFNPEADNVKEQMNVVREALADSHASGLPLFFEIVTYGYQEVGATRGEWVERSVDMFLKAEILPDVFKIEYPEGNDSACVRITEKLGTIPWILLTGGGSYEVFRENLKKAMTAGCKGFLAGRAIWQEIGDHKTIDEKQNFLYNIAKPRFVEIKKIALEL